MNQSQTLSVEPECSLENPSEQKGAKFKYLSKRPTIAWPTIGLLVVVYGLFIAMVIGYLQGSVSLLMAICVNSVAAYLAFTVGHDAAHGAVSRHRWLNDSAGLLSTLLLSPVPFFYMFRFVHMQHHRHVNDVALDPDHYCGRGPRWQLPLRWLTLDLHYFYRYLRPSCFLHRPFKERCYFAAALFFMMLVLTLVVSIDQFTNYCWLFLLPTRVAVFFLAFAFDYLPHYPHNIKASDAPYQATANRVGYEWLLTPLLTYQNYHLAHHLYPAVPFYRYRKIWQSRDAFHLAQQPAQQTAFSLSPLYLEKG